MKRLIALSLLSASCGRVNVEELPLCAPLGTYDYKYTLVSGLDCCEARIPHTFDHKFLREHLTKPDADCQNSLYTENHVTCEAKLFTRCWRAGESLPMTADFLFHVVTDDSVEGVVTIARGNCTGVFSVEGKEVKDDI